LSVRFLYYVSESKVRRLRGQLGPATRLSKLRAKTSVVGFGVEFELGRESVQTDEAQLTSELTDLMRRLRKRDEIGSLQSTDPLSTSVFYEDTGDWRHGLYSISLTGTAEETATYVAWRADGDRIFMLFGSPVNVVGERRVTEGTEYNLGSSRIVGGVMESSLQWEFIQALQSCNDEERDEELLLQLDRDEPGRLEVDIAQRTPPRLVKAPPEALRGSALAALCETALGALPVSSLETVFRIYHALPVSRTFAPYDRVYVGSPVYTALA
jgi:hypothetical protein